MRMSEDSGVMIERGSGSIDRTEIGGLV